MERAEWLLKFLVKRTVYLGQTSVLNFNNLETDDFPFKGSDKQFSALLRAWSGSTHFEEITFLFESLAARKYVTLQQNGRLIQVLPEGFAHVAKQKATPLSDQAFVAMWFDDSMSAAYTKGIEKAVEDAGYKPLRIDSVEHNGKIDDRIIAEIRRSRFVVVDFTSEKDKPRGGVYYEAGFAQGLGVDVIWTCREDMIEHVHFDTRQFNHITWTDPKDLYTKLKTRIEATINNRSRKP